MAIGTNSYLLQLCMAQSTKNIANDHLQQQLKGHKLCTRGKASTLLRTSTA